MNKVILIGNLGRNPEGKETASGMVTKFSIATSFKHKDEVRTEWHNIVAFSKLAELCEKYLLKGKKVCIEGRLQTSSWEGNDGAKKYRTEIIAEQVEFLDSKGSSDKETETETEVSKEVSSSQVDEDDLPF